MHINHKNPMIDNDENQRVPDEEVEGDEEIGAMEGVEGTEELAEVQDENPEKKLTN